MEECLPGIFEVQVPSGQEESGTVNIFIVAGEKGKRSLMIDTGVNTELCRQKLGDALEKMGIDCKNLDVFITHKHYDHAGLALEFQQKGARVFMNPEENRHKYDCLYFGTIKDDLQDRESVLRSVGITKEDTPELWKLFWGANRGDDRGKYGTYIVSEFPYIPVKAGDVFQYGTYCFKAVPLKGHTYGQMGLYEEEKRILFSADQLIDGIAPIVGTSYPDEHILEGYFDSIEDVKNIYCDCQVFPAHGDKITDAPALGKRIKVMYLDKLDEIKKVIDHHNRKITVREMANTIYGVGQLPKSGGEFINLKMVFSKTFSCLEYLSDQGFAVRTVKNGVFYWQRAI